MLIIGILLVLAGVICIFDARRITKKFFGFGDENEASLGFKMIGVIFCVIGLVLSYIWVMNS